MVLETGSIFPTAKEGADEFFIQEAEEALRPRLVIKESDQPIDLTSYVNDLELFMPLSAQRTYRFKCYCFLDTGTDDNIKATFVGPTESEGRYWIEVDDGSVNATFNAKELGADSKPLDGTGAIGGWFVFSGWIKTGNITGNLQLQYKRFDGSFHDMLASSWLEVTRQ